MSSLHSRIQELALEFGESILAVIRNASIEELTGGAGPAPRAPRAAAASSDGPKPAKKTGKGGRLARQSDEDIAAVVESIVECIGNHPEGIRAEELRAELGIEKKELPKPMASALESGLIRKEGEKRATCYFLGSKRGGAKKAAAKPAKKAAHKVSAKPAKKAAHKAKAKPTKKAAHKAKASSKAPTKKAKSRKVDKSANGAIAPAAAESSAALE